MDDHIRIGPGRPDYDVFIQDQVSPPFQYYLMNELKTDITLTSDMAIGDVVANVSAGHGFTTDHYVSIFEANRYVQAKITNVSVNAITLGTPASYAFTVGGATVIRGAIEMAVNGSVTPVEYLCKIRGFDNPVDIDSVIISMIHAGAADDSMFGDLAALTNGVLFQKINDLTFSLGNYRSNQELRAFGAVVDYTDKAGGGLFSTSAYLDVRNKYGIVIRLDPRVGEIMKATVRDNLSALSGLRVSILGQYTVGE